MIVLGNSNLKKEYTTDLNLFFKNDFRQIKSNIVSFPPCQKKLAVVVSFKFVSFKFITLLKMNLNLILFHLWSYIYFLYREIKVAKQKI